MKKFFRKILFTILGIIVGAIIGVLLGGGLWGGIILGIIGGIIGWLVGGYFDNSTLGLNGTGGCPPGGVNRDFSTPGSIYQISWNTRADAISYKVYYRRKNFFSSFYFWNLNGEYFPPTNTAVLTFYSVGSRKHFEVRVIAEDEEGNLYCQGRHEVF